MFLRELKIFCQETTIHGLNHISDEKESLWKRFLWSFIVIACFIYAGSMLYSAFKCNQNSRYYWKQLYIKLNNISFFSIFWIRKTLVWEEQPTKIVVETTSLPIEEIDFPTVTLCPENFNSQRWGPFTKIMNHFELRCEDE